MNNVYYVVFAFFGILAVSFSAFFAGISWQENGIAINKETCYKHALFLDAYKGNAFQKLDFVDLNRNSCVGIEWLFNLVKQEVGK